MDEATVNATGQARRRQPRGQQRAQQ